MSDSSDQESRPSEKDPFPKVLERMFYANAAVRKTEQLIEATDDDIPLDEVMSLAVKYLSYQVESDLHSGDFENTRTSKLDPDLELIFAEANKKRESHRRAREIALNEVVHGEYQKLRDLLQDQTIDIAGNSYNSRRYDFAVKLFTLTQKIPDTGQPLKMPPPAWTDKSLEKEPGFRRLF